MLVLAQGAVRELGHEVAGTEHLLLALTQVDAWVGDLLHGFGVTREKVLAQLAPGTGAPDMVPLGPDWKLALAAAAAEADAQGRRVVGAEHLLLGMLADPAGAASVCLEGLGVQVEELRASVLAVGAGSVVEEEAMDAGALFPLSAPTAVTEGDVLEAAPAPPRCPSCRHDLTDSVRHLRVPVDIEVTVDLVYCGRCGSTLTTRIAETG